LIFNNTTIGNPTEECYLPTWFSHLVRNRDFIKANETHLYPKEFGGLDDREIFEIIIKANETQRDFDKGFLYLPQLNSTIWHRHTFHLDETIDAFIICFYVCNNTIKFIIEKKWPPEENKNRTNFIYPVIALNEFFNAIDDAIRFLEITYPYLKSTL
jgi:hypothetical protein